MKTYYFFDNNSGEEFFVEADSTPSAWRIAVKNGFDETEIECLRIIKEIYESPAALAMIQVQDMFMLGSEARINVPGIAEGNWTWKMPGKSVQDSYGDAAARAVWFRELAEKTGR